MRLLHEGFAALHIIDDDQKRIVLDPREPVDAGVVLLSGGPWAERFAAVDAMIAKRPVFVTSSDVAEWLRSLDASLDVRQPPCTIGGLTIDAVAYTALEPAGGGLDKVRAAIRRPRWASDRLAARRRLPDAAPLAWRLQVPHGHDLVHLGLALHNETPASFLDAVRPWVQTAENVLATYPHGEADAFVRHVRSLRPRRTLITDQTNDLRRAAGLPVDLLTPTRDVLVGDDLEVHVFVSGTSFRFEPDDTVKRW